MSKITRLEITNYRAASIPNFEVLPIASAEASSEGFTAINAGAIGMRKTLKILTMHN